MPFGGDEDELVAVAGDKDALTGRASGAADLLTSGLGTFRSTGSTLWVPLHMSCLAIAHLDLDQFDEA